MSEPTDSLAGHYDDLVEPEKPADEEGKGKTGVASPPSTLPESLTGRLPVHEGYQVPEGYEVDGRAVWAVREKWDACEKKMVPAYSRVAWAPLVVSRVFIDAKGDQTIELAWLDGFRLVTRIVPRSIAKSGRRLVQTLGDAGLPVTDADAKAAERWLAAVESVNSIERRFLARNLGWQPDGTFVASQDSPHRVEVKYDEQAAALAAHAPSGTLQGWQAAVKRLESYPAAQMALYAGFGATLLDVLGINSFALDFSGRSTRGKTTAAAAGLSPWADPSERGDGMYSWRTTMLALEKRLNLVRGLPVVVDETKLVSDPSLVHGVLYQLPKNHGQGRGGGWPSNLPWRTILISTGEQSVLGYTTDQGAAARVLTITAPPFGNDGPESAAAAIEVRDGCADHHGVAGPAFVERLREGLGKSNGRSILIARHKALTEVYRGDTDMSGRRAPMVAALALAAELAYRWEIIPFAPPDETTWKAVFASPDLYDNRPEMALDVVREYVASNGRALWSPHTTDDPPFSGWIGRDIEVDGKPSVALLPEKLKEALGRSGYELPSVLPGWLEQGVLVQNGSYRPAYLIKKGMAGRKVKLYIFAPGHITSSETESDDDE